MNYLRISCKIILFIIMLFCFLLMVGEPIEGLSMLSCIAIKGGSILIFAFCCKLLDYSRFIGE